MRQIKFYKTKSERSPVEEFIDSLTAKQAKKVVWVLRLIEELQLVPRQYFKKLVNTQDIWEVRIQVGNHIFRLLGFFDGLNFLILTNGFAKKSQKTPKREIVLAEQRKDDYLKRRKQSNE